LTSNVFTSCPTKVDGQKLIEYAKNLSTQELHEEYFVASVPDAYREELLRLFQAQKKKSVRVAWIYSLLILPAAYYYLEMPIVGTICLILTFLSFPSTHGDFIALWTIINLFTMRGQTLHANSKREIEIYIKFIKHLTASE
jgi:hypothetical protein